MKGPKNCGSGSPKLPIAALNPNSPPALIFSHDATMRMMPIVTRTTVIPQVGAKPRPTMRHTTTPSEWENKSLRG